MKSRILARDGKLQRRTFLKAIGLGLSVPLAFKMSKLAVAEPTGRPTRLFTFFLPHGMPVEHFDPTDDFDFKARGVGVLEPFEPYKSLVTVPRGVIINGADNHAAIRAVFTGISDAEGVNSIDYTVAQALSTKAHVLGVQPTRSPGQSDADSQVYKHGAWVVPTANPADAADELFKTLGGGDDTGGAAPQNLDMEFRTEALALTEAELEAMQASVKGLRAETNKLAIHLESIRSLKAQSSGAGGFGITCARPSTPSAEAMRGKDPYLLEHFGTVLDGHLEVAAHALVCGTARVISLQNMYANANIMMNFSGGPGVAANHHDPISHSTDVAGRTNFATVQKWFYSRLAEKFLAVLNQPDPADPDHTVLENTTVLIASEIADGNEHNSNRVVEKWVDGTPYPSSLPWVLIGGGGGYLKTGRQVQMDVAHTDILATVAASMGVSLQSVGAQKANVPAELKA